MNSWKLGILVLFVGACGRPDSENAGSDTTPITGAGRGETTSSNTEDPSAFTWARVYCTADNESHIATESVALTETDFAPPAAPLYVGGGGGVTTTFFGGFGPHWGDEDLEEGVSHPTPAVQWLTILTGSIFLKTTDGDSRVFRAGDVMHLEDTAPCKGHISQNTTGEAVFVQFAR
ncbi:MAG TPA: hypothetical protein VFB99_24130 [Vicinamibacterales bacterium]|nr:hypothetical protein [Vicinamibacterales bacterium]